LTPADAIARDEPEFRTMLEEDIAGALNSERHEADRGKSGET
jgi:hypothetical protein